MRKKIGILTFHHSINEGAVLQAYSLLENLKKLMPDAEVEIIDYRSRAVEMWYLSKALKPGRLKDVIGRINRYRKIMYFIENKLSLSAAKLVSDDLARAEKFIEKQGYDGVVVGSDEVWKILERPFNRPFPNIYWLGKKSSFIKTAFAASSNRTDYGNLTENQKKIMKNSLDSFSRITVRDAYTADFLKNLGLNEDREIRIVPDPVFMLDIPDVDIKDKLSIAGVDVKRPIAAVVVRRQDEASKFVEYFKKKKYQVISVSCPVIGVDADMCGKLDVFEWANVFKKISFCVTEKFHPAIFSMLFGKSFLVLDHRDPHRAHDKKKEFLLRETGLTENCVIADDKWGVIFQKMEDLLKKGDSENYKNAFLQRKKICLEALKDMANVLSG